MSPSTSYPQQITISLQSPLRNTSGNHRLLRFNRYYLLCRGFLSMGCFRCCCDGGVRGRSDNNIIRYFSHLSQIIAKHFFMCGWPKVQAGNLVDDIEEQAAYGEGVSCYRHASRQLISDLNAVAVNATAGNGRSIESGNPFLCEDPCQEITTKPA